VCGVGIACLLALRLPSLAQPAGADQSLYIYAGQQLVAGGAPYVDAWDQKPPGVHLLYGLLWPIWPHESVVAAADLGAAVGVCVLLVGLGRRLGMPAAGVAAAALFALLGNPSLLRLSGVFVRGQCETFISLCVTVAIVMGLSRSSRWWTAAVAGATLGIAVWLKYNAIAYALPVWMAWRIADGRGRGPGRPGPDDRIAFAAGLAFVAVAGLGYLAIQHALVDWRLATFDYNLQYSGETYGGASGFIRYVIGLPIRQARHDMLWFLGGAGVLIALIPHRARRAGQLALMWILAALLSIVINGARDLPQYFVQAAPALAWGAGAGLVAAWQTRRIYLRAGVILLTLIGLWRVGTDAPVVFGLRLAGLGGLAENIRFDLDYILGRISRPTYLSRFGGQRDQDKFVALDVDELATHVRNTTTPHESILVFGFSPGVYIKGERRSASRFFWSRPVVIEFEAHRPRYGPSGLLEELTASRPAIIALQKRDWGPAEPNSEAYFLSEPQLAAWLTLHYRREEERRLYSIWRRRE
jgi:hypothetical protein